MSRLILTKGAAPATPAANKNAVYVDTADGLLKLIDANGVITTLSNVGMRDMNLITNGGMTVQQRVATAVTNIAGVSLTSRAGVVADRWAVTVGNVTTPQWTQVDTIGAPEAGLLSRFYGRITQLTTAAKFIFSQYIVATEMADVRGTKVRLSVKIKQFVGSNAVYRLGLLQQTAASTVDVCPTFISAIGANGVEPTWGTNLTAITPDASPTGENGTISGAALSITSTAGWVRSSCVFTVPTDCKALIPVLYRDTTGGISDSLGVSEFQLTQGTEITDYAKLPLMVILNRCERFFAKTFAYATVPVTNAGINTGEAKCVAGKAGAVANAGILEWRFPRPMFKTPTVTLFNPGAANALMRNLTGAADMGATAITAQLDKSVLVIATGVAATAVGDGCGIHITADSEFIT